MADQTLAATDRGIYEHPLTAGQAFTVDVEQAANSGLQFINHGDGLIYWNRGTTITARDAGTEIIAPGGWIDTGVAPGHITTFAFISTTGATLSVTRR